MRLKKEMTLEEITGFLGELRIPTSLVFTPINLDKERSKFFNSDVYNPQFEYRIVKNKNEKILKEISNVKKITDVDPRISDFYISLIDEKKKASELMHAVGNNDLVTEISIERYGVPSAILFNNAARVLRGSMDGYKIVKYPKDPEMLGYEDIEKIFLKVFEELGLREWSVEKSMNINSKGIKVGTKRKEILMDKDMSRSKFKLRKTIVHEIGTHILRAYNGERTGFEALSKPNLPSYLDIEEGLALWNEMYVGALTERWLKMRAALVWAVYLGKDLTFRELYDVVLGVLPKKTAFDIVYRVKRGLGDTSYPGIYTKDIVYFRGLRKVMSRISKEPKLYYDLYAGKIDFEQCDWVEEGLIRKPSIIPPTREEWEKIFKKVGI
jgi:hypothetical protein